MNISLHHIPQDFNGFVAYFKSHDAPLYIFGADIVGKVLNRLVEKHGLTVMAFLDNNKNKCDVEIDGVPVQHASILPHLPSEAVILIASTYIMDIMAQLESFGLYNWVPVSQILLDNAHEDFESYFTGALSLNHSGGEFTQNFATFAIQNMINSQAKYLDETKLFIRSIDLVVTERCSLKCKDCSNLMQYYERPINIARNELYDDLEDICAVADEINEIRIIGGEPFMNREAYDVIRRAGEFKEINKVVVYTNGTICPKDEQIEAMKNEKLFVFITTYDGLSRNADKFAEKLEKFNIPYNLQAAYGWTDCADVKNHHRSPTENTEIFKFCCAKHFSTMTDGRIFRCPFSANIDRLKVIPENFEDSISVRGAARGAKDIHDTKQKLRWYLREKPYLEACNACNGRTYGDPEITPGIQTKTPLPYERFE